MMILTNLFMILIVFLDKNKAIFELNKFHPFKFPISFIGSSVRFANFLSHLNFKYC